MTEPNDPIDHAQRDGYGESNHGLTKREYFAAIALQGYLSMKSHPDIDLRKFNTIDVMSAVVSMADALIKELNKEQK